MIKQFLRKMAVLFLCISMVLPETVYAMGNKSLDIEVLSNNKEKLKDDDNSKEENTELKDEKLKDEEASIDTKDSSKSKDEEKEEKEIKDDLEEEVSLEDEEISKDIEDGAKSKDEEIEEKEEKELKDDLEEEVSLEDEEISKDIEDGAESKDEDIEEKDKTSVDESKLENLEDKDLETQKLIEDKKNDLSNDKCDVLDNIKDSSLKQSIEDIKDDDYKNIILEAENILKNTIRKSSIKKISDDMKEEKSFYVVDEDYKEFEKKLKAFKKEYLKLDEEERDNLLEKFSEEIISFSEKRAELLGLEEIKLKREELEEKFTLAEKLRSETKISEDGDGVSKDYYWIDEDTDKKLYEAIVNAFFVIIDEDSKLNDIEDRLSEIEDISSKYQDERERGEGEIVKDYVESIKIISPSDGYRFQSNYIQVKFKIETKGNASKKVKWYLESEDGEAPCKYSYVKVMKSGNVFCYIDYTRQEKNENFILRAVSEDMGIDGKPVECKIHLKKCEKKVLDTHGSAELSVKISEYFKKLIISVDGKEVSDGKAWIYKSDKEKFERYYEKSKQDLKDIYNKDDGAKDENQERYDEILKEIEEKFNELKASEKTGVHEPEVIDKAYVKSVSIISPENNCEVKMLKNGNLRPIEAEVEVEGEISNAIKWRVEGNTSKKTKIEMNPKNQKWKFVLDKNEKAENLKLIVEAVEKGENGETVSDSINIRIIYKNKPIDDIKDIVAVPDKNLAILLRYYLKINEDEPIKKSALEKLKWFRAASPSMAIKNPEGLQYAVNLEKIDMSNNKLSDLSVFAELKKLKYLDLSNQQGDGITDISPLSSLENIKYLNISKPAPDPQNATNMQDGIEGFKALMSMKQLKHLKCQYAGFKTEDLKYLEPLKNSLEIADLKGCNISDVPEIQNLKNVRELYLDGNIYRKKADGTAEINYNCELLRSMDNFKGFDNLKKLSLDNNQLADLRGIEGCKNLETLNYNYQTSWTGAECRFENLNKLKKLKNLNMSYNGIEDISFLEGMDSIEMLHLESNNISDISVLSTLVNLKQIGLSSNAVNIYNCRNKINTLLPLKNCKKLEHISAAGVGLKSVNGIDELPKLTYLGIQENSVMDLRAVGRAIEGKMWFTFFGGEQAKEIQIDKLLIENPAKDIDGNYVEFYIDRENSPKDAHIELKDNASYIEISGIESGDHLRLISNESKSPYWYKMALNISYKKSEVDNEPEKPEVKPEEPEVKPEEPEVKPEKPEVKPEKPEVKPEEPDVNPEKPDVKPEKPKVKPEEIKCSADSALNIIDEDAVNDYTKDEFSLLKKFISRLHEARVSKKEVSMITEIKSDNDNISNEEKNKFKKAISLNANISDIIDIDLLAKIEGTDDSCALKKVKKAIEIKIDLKDLTLEKEESGYRYSYYVVREHNGMYERISARIKDGKFFTFKSNKFSKFAIACEKSKKSSHASASRDSSRSTKNAAAMPKYIAKGKWKFENGTWKFADTLGNTYVNRWAAVINPYADVVKGQPAYNWFYFNEKGEMITGWMKDGETWYYLNPVSDGTRGAMLIGWNWIDGKCYYLNPISDGTRGKLFVNTKINNWTVNEKGQWTVDGVVQMKKK